MALPVHTVATMSYLQQFVLVEKEERIKSVDFDWRNPYSASKLSRAVRSKNLNLVKKLIKGGCALDAPDNRGWTPLHEAASSDEFYNIAKVLIAAGAYIEHKTVDGETPLIIACKNKAENIVKILIGNNCIVNTRNNEDLTPLHIACCHRNENIIRLLITEGADLNAKDDEDRTPLYLALENVNTVALKILIEAGADFNTKDFFSRTPLQYSCMVGNLEIFNMLIEVLGRDKSVIDQQTPEGWTLLMEAAQYKNYLIAEKLIEYGSDTKLVDNRNLLALHIAAHCERYNVLELLLKTTPKETIELFSTFGRDLTHYRSLPCLIIDKNEYDGLELLYKFGLSEDVLRCPVQMGSHLVSPISFLLLHATYVKNSSKMKILEFLLQFDYLHDPEYKLEDCYSGDHVMDSEIKVVSPIEAALIMHRRTHEDCDCDKFLAMILERGISPDKTPVNLGGCTNMYLFRKAVQLDFYAGLDLLFKYSDKTEPIDVLEIIVNGIINNNNIPTGDEKNMVAHLASKCTYEVNSLVTYVSNKLDSEELACPKTRLIPIKEALKQSVSVPYLKKLSRSAVRKYVHEITVTSSKYSFREYIRNLDLPPYITRYLLYEVDF